MTEITMTKEQREKAVAAGILYLDFYAEPVDDCPSPDPDKWDDDRLFDYMVQNGFRWSGSDWYQVTA